MGSLEGTASNSEHKAYCNMTGAVVWFTGLPCAGKTTLASALVPHMSKRVSVELFDGDEWRKQWVPQLGWSKADRCKNLELVARVASTLARHGIWVLCAFVSPLRSMRAIVRDICRDVEFIEVFVKCSIDECKKRDVKGMWKAAAQGEIIEFTGFSAPYESPYDPDITIDTERASLDSCVAEMLESLRMTDHWFL